MEFNHALAGLVILGSFVATSSVFAAVSNEDPIENSSIEYVQEPQAGSYQSMSIKLIATQGVVQLVFSRDGEKKEMSVPFEDYEALWKQLVKNGAGTIGDPVAPAYLPDLANNTVTLTSGDHSNSFSAYGVDFLEDTRYRAITQAISRFVNSLMNPDSEPPPPVE
jgi:hypothetical protein